MTTTLAPALVIAPEQRKPRRWRSDECQQIGVRRVIDRLARPKSCDRPARVAFRLGKTVIRVSLVATGQRLGGVRWWFVCPSCEGRFGILFSPRGIPVPDFACRRCWDLAYPSQLR